MKKTKGFTLVELVVVLAVIGVLAAILVPTMLNYIRKAKLKAANTNAKTAYHAVVEFFTETNANEGLDTQAILAKYYNNSVIDCNIPPQAGMGPGPMRVHDILANNGINSGHVWVDITQINGVDAIYVQWTGDISAAGTPEAVVGQFPDPVTWETYLVNNDWCNYIVPAT